LSRLPTPRASSRSAESQALSQDDFTSLPSISERLAHLNPSHELLEYYRKKMADFDEEHEELVKRLEKYKQTYDEQHLLQWEVHHLEEEIAELQKALSDMQVYLLQEKEQVLRLYSENDRLKLRELEDRKRIQQLLALLGTDDGEVTYFHKEPPHKASCIFLPAETQEQEDASDAVGMEKNTSKPTAKGEKPESPERYKRDDETLLLQVKALQAQIEEQTRLAKEQVEALLEDRRIQMEEAEVRHRRDQEKIKTVTEKLHKTQNLLYESTRDFLQLKFDARANEKAWMAEKDSLLRKLRKDLDHLVFSTESGKTKQRELKKMIQDDGTSKLHSREIKLLQDKLMQEKHLSHMYREQCVSLEGEVARIREERDAGKELFKERSEKMGKRLKLMTQRCETLEKRRSMEVEGFKNDIKQLQQKLKDVEKQIYKVAQNLGPDQDLAILREVCQGNKLTRKIQGEIKDLKAKIYRLEDELRFC
ncbi:CCD77 protein, partial [Lanius ludovicianus]|nr:CCD77 protein [Lanius ludovicianus]